LTMSVYYNEFEPFAAQWLRELMADGLIAQGEVDERSILDVRPADLRGYDQCHFFAGIGGWSYALRLAGWPDDRPVWTGSCPCQPLSSAGKQKGHADERHIWPAFYELIAECRPSTVFGEQVASKDGSEWLAGVRADLEDARYAVGAADLCAAGVGAPHIRQRLFWVAQSPDARPPRAGGKPQPKSALIQPGNGSGKEGTASRVAHAQREGLNDTETSGRKRARIKAEKRTATASLTLGASQLAQMAGWPTPRVSDKTAGRTLDSEGRRVSPSGVFGANLSDLAQTAGWPTPMAGTPAQNGNNAAGNNDSSRKTVELVSGWPTPRVQNTRTTQLRTDQEKGHKSNLEEVVCLVGGSMAGWATPTTRDHKDGASTLDNTPINSLLGRQATLSPAPTESGDESPPTKRASLNPAFSLWLMGYPIEWAHCAARVTRSRRKSRQPS
jgi:DNA (cytosine-5)-methyltransferase 1